ncbi:MAG: hypothetical protein JJT81_16645 [Rubellimicrobium sp.]|nr:hypothetical protein [Rubellimicrobium sp.]
MRRFALAIEIRIRSPFLFPDTVSGAFGLDRIALRDAKGRPVLPQEQVRGVLFHACRDAAQAMQKKRDTRLAIFGRGSADSRDEGADQSTQSADFEPARGRILFSDLVADTLGASQRSVRVAIDPDTGAAEDGKLMFAELVAPPGASVSFTGQAVLLATQQEAAEWVPLITGATSWVSAIGAMKSAGFGEVEAFIISRKADAPLAANVAAIAPDWQQYALRFDRRFAVDVRRVAANVYVGQDVVPGGVIKGALARKLDLCGQLPALNAALSALSISHAMVRGAPPAVPLSMVFEPVSAKVGDALLLPRHKGAMIDGAPTIWRSDWKPEAEAAVRRALRLAAHPELARTVRTHVAISEETGAAADRKLFVIDALDPGTHQWQFTVDYGAVGDAAARNLLAAALEAGLDGIGRTGARAEIDRIEAPPVPAVAPIAGTINHYAVVLETDAVMACPTDAADAQDAYRLWWKRALPEAELVNFYASQRLAGGYVARRYAPVQGYQPFWLTEAGSVFVLKGDIAGALATLTKKRLPAPIIGGVTTSWKTCPYQPENGYGAIRCDHLGEFASVISHV